MLHSADTFKVSIITASYNYEKYIIETIESVLAQTYENWELIIVDDGSSDNSVNVIKEYCLKDNRIKLFQHENGVNKGLAETVKLGLEKASSDWVAFLESDDTIAPNYIEEKVNIIKENPEVKFIFNDINCFGDEDVIRSYDKYFEKQKNIISVHKNPDNYLKSFLKTNIVPTFSCVMLKKELMNRLDYNSPSRTCLDMILWAQVARFTDFYYLNKKLTNWRMHKNSYISSCVDLNSQVEMKKSMLKLIYHKKNEKLVLYFRLLLADFTKVFRMNLGRRQIYVFGHMYKF